MAKSPLSYAVRLGTFYAAGMTVYSFRDTLPRSRQLTILCFALILFSLLNRYLLLIALPTAGVYLLFRFVYADRVFVPALKQKVGDLSYGVYLYGWPVAQSLIAIANPKMLGVWNLATISILCTLPISYFSWHCIEKRFLALIPRT
jgi:peptidoglycan/LPS O-acetylase OafA/YrhL